MKPYITKNENALLHECGFSCDNAVFFRLDRSNAFFLTDARYSLEAREFIKNAQVLETKNLIKSLKNLIRKTGVKSLMFDPKELSADIFFALSKNSGVKFVSALNFSQKKRMIKTENEIKTLKTAATLGEKAFGKFCDFLKKNGIGKSEEELFFNAEIIFKDNGKLNLSFPPIVAINENSAKPHAKPTKKRLKEGDIFLLDAGVLYGRYCSDRTRTIEINGDFNFSKEQKFQDSFRQKIYDIVLKANEKAIKSVKIGIKASEIDKVARDVINESGYGKFFVHSTGHGVGLDIHELPIISPKSDTIIEENMVFTIEPGIYLPNQFGVRIEDTIIVQNGKAVVL